jgi:carbon monoxide dehydrogenase subunit G
MARYITTVRTSLPPAEAFAYMADLSNLAKWDPGVSRAVKVRGEGLGATYDVTVTVGTRPTLRYEVIEHDSPRRVRFVARTGALESYDEIRVERDGAGALVTYDATLTLRGPLGLFDRGLQLVFDRIGDRAADGLRRALSGDGGGTNARRASDVASRGGPSAG